MTRIKSLALGVAALASIGLGATAPSAQAQISVNIGVAPECPYGYYDTVPYSCAPYGYYGPEWFSGGAFVGAGPWFHGPANFHGHVDNHFDVQHGYKGPLPERGAKPDGAHPVGRVDNFKGNEDHDGHGGRH